MTKYKSQILLLLSPSISLSAPKLQRAYTVGFISASKEIKCLPKYHKRGDNDLLTLSEAVDDQIGFYRLNFFSPPLILSFFSYVTFILINSLVNSKKFFQLNWSESVITLSKIRKPFYKVCKANRQEAWALHMLSILFIN